MARYWRQIALVGVVAWWSQFSVLPLAADDGTSPPTISIRPGKSARALVIETRVVRGPEKRVLKLFAKLPLESFSSAGNGGVVPASATKDRDSKPEKELLVPFRKASLTAEQAYDIFSKAKADSRMSVSPVPKTTVRVNHDYRISIDKQTVNFGYHRATDGEITPIERDAGVSLVVHPVVFEANRSTMELVCEQNEPGPLRKTLATGADGKQQSLKIPDAIKTLRASTVCSLKPGDIMLLTGITRRTDKQTEAIAVILTVVKE